jgi:hypothetical protein
MDRGVDSSVDDRTISDQIERPRDIPWAPGCTHELLLRLRLGA